MYTYGVTSMLTYKGYEIIQLYSNTRYYNNTKTVIIRQNAF